MPLLHRSTARPERTRCARRAGVVAILVGLAFGPGAHGAAPLRVAVFDLAGSATAPSAESPDGANGLISSFWSLWSERASTPVELVPVGSAEEAITALESERVDIVGALPIHDAVHPSISPSRPFARLTRAIVAPKGFAVEDLRGQALRVQGPRVQGEIGAIATAYEVATLQELPDAPLAAWFQDGTDPVLTLSVRHSSRRIQEQGFESRLEAHPLTHVPLFAATARDRQDVLTLFHDGLSRISAMDLDELDPDEGIRLPHFFLEPRDRFDLSSEEIRWLREHPVVRLGASSWPPLTLVDADGRYTGIGIETVRELLSRLSIRLEVAGATDWARVIGWARERRIDGLGFTVRLADEDFLYSDPVIRSPAVIVNRIDAPFFGSLEDLSEGRLAVLDYRTFSNVPNLVRPTIELVSAPDSNTAVEWTSKGEVDAMLDLLPSARGAIRSQNAGNLKVTATVPELSSPLLVAVRPDWPELVSLLNHAIATRSQTDETRLLDRFSDRGLPSRLNLPILAVLISLSATTLFLGVSLVRRRLETNRLLRESEALLRSAQRLSRSGSWRLEGSSGNIEFSAESFRLFGNQRDAVPSSLESYLRYYEPNSRSRLRDVLEDPPQPGRTAEVRMLRSSDGAQVHDCVIEASKGDLVGTVADVTDIHLARTEREQMQERLRQTERLDALARLAGGIAHDFNNILAASMTNTQLARMEIPEDHEAQESLQEVMAATERARELVRQIQIFGRRSTPERDPVDLRACIDSVISLLRASLPPNVDVRWNLPKEPLNLHGSGRQIERMLMNLGMNAGEAMAPNGGTIQINARRVHTRQPLLTATGEIPPGDYVQLQVSDTGCGIADDDLPRIFDPYFTRRSEGGGTGLGLSLVHGIVQDHEGGLAVSSSTTRAAGDVATTFSIWLPLSAAAASAPTQRRTRQSIQPWSEPVSRRHGRGQNILVVDDQPHVLRSTVRMLEALGVEPTGFSSSAAALDDFLADPDRWRAVVTDLLMPVISGAELAERIKEIRPELPIILMTGHAGDVDLESAATDAVIFKPALPGAWIEALRQLGVIDPGGRHPAPPSGDDSDRDDPPGGNEDSKRAHTG